MEGGREGAHHQRSLDEIERQLGDSPGLRRDIVVHVKRYDASGPYVCIGYACAPPFLRRDTPSSANEVAPVHAGSAATAHMTRVGITLWVCAIITPGEGPPVCDTN